MKTFAIASVIALASVANAQLDKIPACALNCFIGPLSSDGCAQLTDFKCHCEKGATLIAAVQPCVQSACPASDQVTTLSAVEETCKAAGVPLALPNLSSAAPAPSSAAAPASSAAASAIPSAPPAASSVASSAAGGVSSAVASAVSSLASRASSAASAATSAASSARASASSSVSQFTGGAPQATKAAGLLGAAAIAMLAL